MKISNNLEMSSMRALGSLPSKVSGFADSGGRGARSWVAGGGGGGGYGYGIQGSMEIQEVVRQDKAVLQEVHQVALQGVRCGRQDRRELQGLQEALGSETVEVRQKGCQEG